MKGKALALIALAALVGLLIAGCGKNKPKTVAATPTPVTAKQLPAEVYYISGGQVWSTNGIDQTMVTTGGTYQRVDGSLAETTHGQVSVVVIWQTGGYLFPVSLPSGELIGTASCCPAVALDHYAAVQLDQESGLRLLNVDGDVVYIADEIVDPIFSTQGNKLAFAASDHGSPLRIHIYNVGTKRQPQVLEFKDREGEHQAHPSFGDSEQVLYFTSGSRLLWDVYSIELRGQQTVYEAQQVTNTGNSINPAFFRNTLLFQRCEEFDTRSRDPWPSCASGSSTIWAAEAGTGLSWKVVEGEYPSWDRFKRQKLPQVVAVAATPIPPPTPRVVPTQRPAATPAPLVPTTTPTPIPVGEARIVDWPCAEGLNLHRNRTDEPPVWVTFESIIYRIPWGSEVTVLESAQYESEWENSTRPGDDTSFTILRVRYTDKDGKVWEGWVRENATHKPGESPTIDRSVCAELEQEELGAWEASSSSY